mmetsp:Transcript_6382/g.17944  ORF Transcript_6382/g.17944 Transcript_6382/m.17944 type:complete len:278 (-) Transcript_6382:81-914(-)
MDTASALRRLDPATYLSHFVAKGVRPDGRALDHSRPWTHRTGTLAGGAAGSAIVQLGRTRVLCRAVLRAGQPPASAPDSGDVDIQIVTPPLCGRHHGVRGGRKTTEGLALEALAKQALVRSGFVDCSGLSLSKGRLAWQVGLECVCLSDAGNLADAALGAAVLALKDARIPPHDVEDGVVFLRDGGAEGDGMDEEEAEGAALPLSGAALHATTLGVFRGHLLNDPSLEELPLLDAAVTVVTDDDGNVCAVHKAGGAAVGPDLLERCVDFARSAPRRY